MKTRKKDQKCVNKMAKLHRRQQKSIREAMEYTYQRQVWEFSKDDLQRIIITPVHHDLYVVTLSRHFKGIPADTESWKAIYNWATSCFMEIGGWHRSCYFDPVDGKLYLERNTTYPIDLLTFQRLN